MFLSPCGAIRSGFACPTLSAAQPLRTQKSRYTICTNPYNTVKNSRSYRTERLRDIAKIEGSERVLELTEPSLTAQELGE